MSLAPCCASMIAYDRAGCQGEKFFHKTFLFDFIRGIVLDARARLSKNKVIPDEATPTPTPRSPSEYRAEKLVLLTNGSRLTVDAKCFVSGRKRL